MTDDQQKVIEALEDGTYKIMAPKKSISGTNYMTNSGIEFAWLHGLGDGKDVTIFGERQSAGFAKKVREYLEK